MKGSNNGDSVLTNLLQIGFSTAHLISIERHNIREISEEIRKHRN